MNKMSDCRTLAFEIGTEEIPAFDLERATKQLETLVGQAFDDKMISHGDIGIYSTPRRLVAIVKNVMARTEKLVEEHKGPSLKIAFDEDGKPTKAAIGFARGKGVDVDSLEIREVDGTSYVFATTVIEAKDVADLLPDVLLGIIESINWPKSMKWGCERALFSRPVRWICALLGDDVIDVRFADVASSNMTFGHRFLAPGPHEVGNANELLEVIRAAYVVPSQLERAAVIRAGVEKAEIETGYTAQLPQKTFTEVMNLSEYPTVMVGTFSEEFLEVPEEIIVDAMLMHQRYFPLYDNGKLTNKFIIVSNGNPEFESIIVDGNERVVAARLYDAKFFYNEDLKKPLESYVGHLNEVVFQEQLGTMLDKTNRVSHLAYKIALQASLEAIDAGDVSRAAYLAKADLVTNAVIEFTSVQGIMGSYYAKAAGENERVARAVAEHYRPRFAGDDVPQDVVGKIVAIADKLDTICGLFAIDQGPSGSSDPFALRRAALGIIAILQTGVEISLEEAINDALAIYQETGLKFDRTQTYDEIVDFFITRTRVLLHDSGIPTDAIEAVCAVGVVEPVVIIERVGALQSARERSKELFDDLATAYGRANNLRDASLGSDFDASLFNESERDLNRAIDEASTSVKEALEGGDYAVALQDLSTLRSPIDEFFETTMVMDENPDIRSNRIKLLNRFVAVFSDIADFSKMVKAK